MEVQDRTFYPDDIERLAKMDNTTNQLKRKMTLDFNSSSSIKTKQQKMANLLQSPDLNLLKLASPELERMIIQANGIVTTTPTPTQFIFPKYVTDEQEAYARGFVEALANLHNTKPENDLGDSMDSTDSEASVSYPNPSSTNVLALTTTTSLPGGLVNPTSSTMTITSQSNKSGKPTTVTQMGNIQLRFKEEPQTVPCIESNSPPLSPIDMESQERIKLERKRARNRVAARKCRTRKLERISRLEDKVAELKGQNSNLANTATTLREQVCKLKQQIIEHVNSGCQIMMSNSINFS